MAPTEDVDDDNALDGKDQAASRMVETQDAAEEEDAPAQQQAATTTTQPPPQPRRLGRRLHTLSGAIALGVFLVEHLLTNASALGGEARFDSVVGVIERTSVLPFIEIVFILIPLGFHVGYGLLLLNGKGGGAPDSEIDRYGDRRLWVVQRISGLTVLAFMLFHLWELRVQKLFFGAQPQAFHTMLTAHLSWTWAGVPWLALAYVLGIAATTFHFSNGLFAATAPAIVLGVKGPGVTTPAQPTTNEGNGTSNRRNARILSSVLGGVLFVIGSATVIGLATGTRLLPALEPTTAATCGPSSPPPAAKTPNARPEGTKASSAPSSRE